jgi:hypothetical protein
MCFIYCKGEHFRRGEFEELVLHKSWWAISKVCILVARGSISPDVYGHLLMICAKLQGIVTLHVKVSNDINSQLYFRCMHL